MDATDLERRISPRFTLYDLVVDIGETAALNLDDLPQNPETVTAMQRYAVDILEPVVEKFGEIRITYGFASPTRARAVRKWGTYQPGDQHAGHERAGEQPVCKRLGFATDFYVPGVSTAVLAQWVVEVLPWDRIYYYGWNRSLHVSMAPLTRVPARSFVDMMDFPAATPRRRNPDDFLDRYREHFDRIRKGQSE